MENISPALLDWFYKNQRILPFRTDPSPYHVWLSEIMLQQTRVSAALPYYERFLAALPDIPALAACEEEKLHKLWEGLGYYSRVRNLKKAAQVIVSQYGGRFPQTYEEVLALPGIGEYTAGAICSIAFNLPTPAVDGNVLRVCSRLANDPAPIDAPATKKQVREALVAIYPEDAGTFTQALMELGATLCGPNRKPDCDACPCQSICLSHRSGTAESLPVKSPKKEKRQEEKTVFILRCGNTYALEKRPSRGLLAGLWQFPNVSGRLSLEEALQWATGQGLHPRDILREVSRKHIFTHIQWHMTGYYLDVNAPGDFRWFTAQEIDTLAALPTAFRQFWEETDHV